jgi:CheY-like chemotaxis protein
MPKRTHVLVVEDSDVLRRAAMRTLRDQVAKQELPVDLLETDRAQSALDMILANPDDAWFIFTDNNLERSDGAVQTGLDLIVRIHHEHADIRSFRVLTSGEEMPGIGRDLFGVDLFVQKPANVLDVIEHLKAFLASP